MGRAGDKYVSAIDKDLALSLGSTWQPNCTGDVIFQGLNPTPPSPAMPSFFDPL